MLNFLFHILTIISFKMIISTVFYLLVSVALYLLVLNSTSAQKTKKYTRSELISLQSTKKLPADWVSIKSIQQNFQAKPIKFQPRPQKFRKSDNKENNPQPKLTLSNFILKELETTVQELTQKPSAILNPHANEFISSSISKRPAILN